MLTLMNKKNRGEDVEATKVYDLFKKKEGSEHIATPLSISMVQKLARKSERILEIGGGIGTLTYAMLSCSDAKLDVYEDNNFCIQKLQENLREFSERYTLLTSYEMQPPRTEYDLVIIDGANGKKHDGGRKDVVFDFFSSICSKIIYFEGVRRPQRRYVREALRGICAIRIKRMSFEGIHKGGTVYYCFNAFPLVREILYWWNTIRENPKIENYFGRIKPPSLKSEK